MGDIRNVGVAELAELGPAGLSALEEKIAVARRTMGATAMGAVASPEDTFQSLDTLASPRSLNVESIVPLHAFMAAKVNEAILDGKLPASFELQAIEAFADQAAQLSAVYETFAANFWDPAVVFVPRQLQPSEMTDLFSGFKLGDDGIRESEVASIADGIDDPRKVTFLNGREDRKYDADGPRWELAVASSGGAILFPKLTPKGEGRNAEGVVEALKSLGLKSDGTPEGLIEASSPSALMYMSLQWQRLLCGRQPLGSTRNDPVGAVILKEKIRDERRITADGNYEKTLSGEWLNNSEQLRITTVGTLFSEHMLWGVNPMVRARDLVL